MLIPWLNLGSAIVSAFIFSYFYLLSVQPTIRAETHGEKAWEDCHRFRILAAVFALIAFTNIIFWFWFPIPGLTWLVYPHPLVPVGIGFILAIAGAVLVIKAMKDVGKETWQPSEDIQMASGIYRHIRHPQLLGRALWFIAITLWVNSLFLLIIVGLFIIVLVPLIIHFEEKDLIKRYGQAYHDYKKLTGALIPKFWMHRNQE